MSKTVGLRLERFGINADIDNFRARQTERWSNGEAIDLLLKSGCRTRMASCFEIAYKIGDRSCRSDVVNDTKKVDATLFFNYLSRLLNREQFILQVYNVINKNSCDTM